MTPSRVVQFQALIPCSRALHSQAALAPDCHSLQALQEIAQAPCVRSRLQAELNAVLSGHLEMEHKVLVSRLDMQKGSMKHGRSLGVEYLAGTRLGDRADGKMLESGGRRCRSRSVTLRCQDTVGLAGAPRSPRACWSLRRSSALPPTPGFLRMPVLARGDPP